MYERETPSTHTEKENRALTTKTDGMNDEEAGSVGASPSRSSVSEGQPTVFPMDDETGGRGRGMEARSHLFPDRVRFAARVPIFSDGVMPDYAAHSSLATDMSIFAEEQRRMRLGESCRAQAPQERQPTPIPNMVRLMHTPEQQHYVFVPTNLSFYHQYSFLPVNSHQRATEVDNLTRSLSQAHIGHVPGSDTTRTSTPLQMPEAHAEAFEPRSFDERRLHQLWKDHDNMSL